MNLRPIHLLRAGSKHDKELYVLKETTDIISFIFIFLIGVYALILKVRVDPLIYLCVRSMFFYILIYNFET